MSLDESNVQNGLDFPARRKDKKTRNQYVSFERNTCKSIGGNLKNNYKKTQTRIMPKLTTLSPPGSRRDLDHVYSTAYG